MKRAKQKNLYEDKSGPVGDLDLQFDGDDDDIIDLEDIIEMPDRPIDEDEDLDLDVEIFEVDEALQSPPSGSSGKSAGLSVPKSAQEAEEEDLLASFGIEADEEEVLFEPTASVSTETPSARQVQEEISDEEEEAGLDDLLAEPDPGEEQRVKQAALRARAEAALKVAEEEQLEETLTVAQEAQPEEAAAPSASEAAAPAGVADASMSEISAAAEELIGRIESRLQEHIRVVVESMLPGLVRSIIDEEITKLQKELE